MKYTHIIPTTLSYIKKDGKYLMLLRNKKKSDVNKGKWIGVGGKFLEGEKPEECLTREVFEETGLTLTKYILNGVVRFVSDGWEPEDMYLYTGLEFEGELLECNEGTLAWIPEDEIMGLNLWEGDRIFLQDLLNHKEDIYMRLEYKGDDLVDCRRFNSLKELTESEEI